MSTAATIDDLVNKVRELNDSDRQNSCAGLNEPAHRKTETNGSKTNGQKQEKKKGFVLHPNTVWIKENSHRYPGQYVVLDNGKLISTGRTFKEADLSAKAKGHEKTGKFLFHRILAEGEEAWGGW